MSTKKNFNFYYPPAKPLNYKKFWDSKFVQDFSLPNPLIVYIFLLNPSANVYPKLLQTCKHFYAKNPYLMVQEMFHINSVNWVFWPLQSPTIKLSFTPNFGKNGIDVVQEIKNQKLWILKSLYLVAKDQLSLKTASYLTTKIYRCEIKNLKMFFQKLTLNEFIILTPSAETCVFQQIVVTDKNEDDEVPFEMVLQNLPKLITLEYEFYDYTKCITPKTFHNFLRIPHLRRIKWMKFTNIREYFDAEAFVEYLQIFQNRNKYIFLYFNNISEEYKSHLDALITDILNRKTLNFVPPKIHYYGMNLNLRIKLLELLSSMPENESPGSVFINIGIDQQEKNYLNLFFSFFSSNNIKRGSVVVFCIVVFVGILFFIFV